MRGAAARSFAITAGAALFAIGCHARDDRPAAAAPDPAAKALADQARHQAACDVVIAVVADGTWVGNAGGARRFVARCGRDPDTRAAAHELQSFLLAARADCPPTVDVGGGPGADFYDLLVAMDAARMAGFFRIGMSGASDLVATFPTAPSERDRAPADCPPAEASTDAGIPAANAPVSLEAPRISGRALRGDEQLVIVSVDAETISVNGKAAAAVGASSLGLIPDLARALPPPTSDPIVVVSGDRHLDAALVARVIRTLSMSGYKDIRFMLATH